MNESTNTADQNQILGFLARVDRRLRVNEAIEGLTLGIWGLCAVLVLSRLFGLWENPTPRTTLLLIYGAGLAAFVIWSFTRRKGLSAPARVADDRSDSKDTLVSSLDFIRLPERTHWMDFQIRRTAAFAAGLSPTKIAPTVLPKPLYYASGLALGLAVLLSWNPVWLQDVDATTWFTSGGSLAADAESPPEGAELVPEQEEKLQDIDEARKELRKELEMPESLRDLEAAKEALAASRLEMEQLATDLENLGTELESTAALGDLAEAMKSKDAQKAAELLRSLAEKLKNAQTSEELQALMDSLKDANVQQADLAELLERLEKAQESMDPEALAEMAQALQDAANQLDSVSEQMAADQALETMGEEMQSLQAAMGQQQAGEQQPGQQQQAGGQATQSAGMMSSQLQMAQFQGDPSSAVPVDAGPAGDATGPGGGEEPVLGEATTLDVQLEMELLPTEERDEPIPEEIFERLSRQEKSTLNYEALDQRGSYAEDSALEHASIPWLYRSLVKQYFLTIVSKSEAKSESGPSK